MNSLRKRIAGSECATVIPAPFAKEWIGKIRGNYNETTGLFNWLEVARDKNRAKVELEVAQVMGWLHPMNRRHPEHWHVHVARFIEDGLNLFVIDDIIDRLFEKGIYPPNAERQEVLEAYREI